MPQIRPAGHAALLALFACGMVFVWMAPVLLMGQIYDVYPLLLARNFAEAGAFSLTDELGRFLAPQFLGEYGVLSTADGRLSAVLLAMFAPSIGWTDFIGWGFVASATIALSLIAWWVANASFFGRRIAWISTVLLAFFPVYWRQAVWLNHYNFAILFLFLSFAAFACLRRKAPLLAFGASGLLFGLSVASKDAFLVFLPWYVFAYAWLHRNAWRKALPGGLLFLACAGLLYLAPYIGDIRTQGYPVNQNIALFWPGAQEVREGFYLHLYPDPYTYHFDRAAFDESLLKDYENMSQLEKLRQQKIFINFDVGQPSLLTKTLNGAWLFLGSIPTLFQLDGVGGAALWIFILPGIAVLWRKDRRFTVLLLGLLLSSEFLMRFVLHYARGHLMDYGWMFALFAAVGVAAVADACSRSWKRLAPAAAAAFFTLLLAAHLVQANRIMFARSYSRTFVPQALALASAIDTTAEDAVVAVGMGSTRVEQLAQLSHRTVVIFDSGTVQRLLDSGAFADAFRRYGITHVLGYDAALTDQMIRAMPALDVLEAAEAPVRRTVTPGLNYLLHLIR